MQLASVALAHIWVILLLLLLIETQKTKLTHEDKYHVFLIIAFTIVFALWIITVNALLLVPLVIVLWKRAE